MLGEKISRLYFFSFFSLHNQSKFVEGQHAELRQVADGGRQKAIVETDDIEGSDLVGEAPYAATRDGVPSAETGGGVVGPTGEDVGRVEREKTFKREK